VDAQPKGTRTRLEREKDKKTAAIVPLRSDARLCIDPKVRNEKKNFVTGIIDARKSGWCVRLGGFWFLYCSLIVPGPSDGTGGKYGRVFRILVKIVRWLVAENTVPHAGATKPTKSQARVHEGRPYVCRRLRRAAVTLVTAPSMSRGNLEMHSIAG
jgi:hypothetical protein